MGFLTDKKKYVLTIMSRLKKRYKNELKTYLEHSNPWELLVATILSAQSQDIQVNKITRKLFKDYGTIESYANLSRPQLYKYIKSIGLYRNKAKNIIRTAQLLIEKYDSQVPKSIEELITLPGVGRKTANVVLSNAYNINDGIAIDTHCITVSNRLKLINSKDPKKIEQRLMQLLPASEWGNVNHLFIALGRDVCTARTKHCSQCVLNDICPSSTVR